MERKKNISVNIKRNKRNIKIKSKVKKLVKRYTKTKDDKVFNRIVSLIDNKEKNVNKKSRLIKKLYSLRNKGKGDSRI
ncbi:hypothetical protein JSR06_00160 [Candidatus Vidania fulgoroideae]|uniref:Uncharacterized protein n=1 Tax=Candidatus Vidania fulgoroideorum TaxID=881286 RepID=A0A974X7H2_9PROT|nr:hypothetical protein JSR06_00160 [Candidatus Vidania fulgoroideae]